MNLDRLRRHGLALPGTTAQMQWGNNLVFKVAGKMFLVVSLDESVILDLSFKVSPVDFRKLPREYDGIKPAPYLARASWLALEDPDVLPEAELLKRIKGSYELVRSTLPKKVQAELGG